MFIDNKLEALLLIQFLNLLFEFLSSWVAENIGCDILTGSLLINQFEIVANLLTAVLSKYFEGVPHIE